MQVVKDDHHIDRGTWVGRSLLSCPGLLSIALLLQVRNVLTTCFVYCGPFFLTFCFNNTVAWIYGVRWLEHIHV